MLPDPVFKRTRQPEAVRQSSAVLMCGCLLLAGCQQQGRWDDVRADTLSATTLLDLALDEDAPIDVRKRSHFELGERLEAASETEEVDPDVTRIIEAITTEWLGHENCRVRRDGWNVVTRWLWDLIDDGADETARRRGLETLRAVALEAGSSITNPPSCVSDPLDQETTLEERACSRDDRYWSDSIRTTRGRLPPETCLQLDIAVFLRWYGPQLDDRELIEPLVHLALAAPDPAVRGRILSLLHRRVLPRGQDLIEMVTRRLANDPHPDVRERALELLDPGRRFVTAIPIDLGAVVEGRIAAHDSGRQPPSEDHPVYELVLEQESRVIVDLVGLGGLNPILRIFDESGSLLGLGIDSYSALAFLRQDPGGGGDAREIVTLPPGRYYLYPGSNDGSPGDFRISTRVF